jgi:hypothetical protein
MQHKGIGPLCQKGDLVRISADCRRAIIVGACIAGVSVAASPTANAGAPFGARLSLSRLFNTWKNACLADLGQCGPGDSLPGGDQRVNAAAVAFCNTLLPLAKPFLSAIGMRSSAAPYAYSAIFFEYHNSETTGLVLPSLKSIGGSCGAGGYAGNMTQGMSFTLWAPPKGTVSISGYDDHRAGFGKPCWLSQSMLACQTPNGWTFDISADAKTNVAPAIMKEQYDTLATSF